MINLWIPTDTKSSQFWRTGFPAVANVKQIEASYSELRDLFAEMRKIEFNFLVSTCSKIPLALQIKSPLRSF